MKIKYLLPAVLLLVTCATNIAHAQTLNQNLAKNLSDASKNIFNSAFAPEYKADFERKLAIIGSDANCRAASAKSAAPFECGNPPPTLLEAAMAKIAQLAGEMNATFAVVGNRTLLQVYTPKLAELTQKIAAGKIDAPEARALGERIKLFFDKRNARLSAVANADAQYLSLAADIDAAIKLSAASASNNSFLMQYQEKLKATQEKIAKSKLNPITQADLQRDLLALSRTIQTPRVKPTPAEFAKADADLTAFNTRIEQTILLEGSKSFKDLANAKLDVLDGKVRAAKLDTKDSAALAANIAALRKQIDSVKIDGVTDANGKQQLRMFLDAFDAQVAKLSMDIDAAIALNAERGKAATLSAALTVKTNALNMKIEQARLNNFFRNDFLRKVFEAAGGLLEVCDGKVSGDRAGYCDASRLYAADNQLDALSITVDKIITTYGSKSMSMIYGVAVNEAQVNLSKSAVGASDKMGLNRRLDNVKAMIQNAGTLSPRPPGSAAARPDRKAPFTAEQLHNDVSAAVAEINAAIRLATPK